MDFALGNFLQFFGNIFELWLINPWVQNPWVWREGQLYWERMSDRVEGLEPTRKV